MIGFWQAILYIVITGVSVNALVAILRGIFRDASLEETPIIRRLMYNILYWGSFTALFFIIWHIRQGLGWLIFGIISSISFIGSLIGSMATPMNINEKERRFIDVTEKMKKINEDKIAQAIKENKGKQPVYEIYNSYAIAIGLTGETYRKENRIQEALECDFQGIALMEKAIDLSDEAPEEKQIQYKRDIVIACIYVASDLLKMSKLYDSIHYCEKIIKYAGSLPSLDDLEHSILVHAANYDERNLDMIEKKFGEQGVRASLEIGTRLRNLT